MEQSEYSDDVAPSKPESFMDRLRHMSPAAKKKAAIAVGVFMVIIIAIIIYYVYYGTTTSTADPAKIQQIAVVAPSTVAAAGTPTPVQTNLPNGASIAPAAAAATPSKANMTIPPVGVSLPAGEYYIGEFTTYDACNEAIRKYKKTGGNRREEIHDGPNGAMSSMKCYVTSMGPPNE